CFLGVECQQQSSTLAKSAEDQEIERALEQLEPFRFFSGRHSTRACAPSGKMSTQNGKGNRAINGVAGILGECLVSRCMKKASWRSNQRKRGERGFLPSSDFNWLRPQLRRCLLQRREESAGRLGWCNLGLPDDLRRSYALVVEATIATVVGPQRRPL